MKFTENASAFNGHLNFAVKRNGEVVDTYDNHNLIVTAGRQRMAELLAGASSAHVTHVGIGTGTDAASIDDTALKDQVLIPVTGTKAEGKVAHFDFTIDTGTGNGLKIREFGLFCADGTMFSHRVRTGVIEKADDIEIEGYWEIRF